MDVPRLVQTLTGHALRFLLPWACAGCRTPLESIEDTGFCGRCWLSIPRIQGLICRFCGVPLPDGGNLCFSCRRDPPRILIRAAVSYSSPIPQAIHRFKYAGRKTLSLSFKALMAYGWTQSPELHPIDALVPVPLHQASFHERGYNQATLLAEALGLETGLPLLKDVLLRTRKGAPQVRLRRAERLTNLQAAFSLAPGAQTTLKGLHVLLIDDVCTTGTTLQECARVLKRGGAKGVKALTLARDS